MTVVEKVESELTAMEADGALQDAAYPRLRALALMLASEIDALAAVRAPADPPSSQATPVAQVKS